MTDDLSTVHSQRNDLAAEEFPEGPYGSGLPAAKPGKSAQRRRGQHCPRPYGYENRKLHKNLPRHYSGEDEEDG